MKRMHIQGLLENDVYIIDLKQNILYKSATLILTLYIGLFSGGHKILGRRGGGFSTCLPMGFRCPFKVLRYANLSDYCIC